MNCYLYKFLLLRKDYKKKKERMDYRKQGRTYTEQLLLPIQTESNFDYRLGHISAKQPLLRKLLNWFIYLAFH